MWYAQIIESKSNERNMIKKEKNLTKYLWIKLAVFSKIFTNI